MIFNSNLNLLKAIGNTPCVKLENLSKLTNHEVWAKLEFMNPGGSIKDRIAMYMIEKAEKRVNLNPGTQLLKILQAILQWDLRLSADKKVTN